MKKCKYLGKDGITCLLSEGEECDLVYQQDCRWGVDVDVLDLDPELDLDPRD